MEVCVNVGADHVAAYATHPRHVILLLCSAELDLLVSFHELKRESGPNARGLESALLVRETWRLTKLDAKDVEDCSLFEICEPIQVLILHRKMAQAELILRLRHLILKVQSILILTLYLIVVLGPAFESVVDGGENARFRDIIYYLFVIFDTREGQILARVRTRFNLLRFLLKYPFFEVVEVELLLCQLWQQEHGLHRATARVVHHLSLT